MTAPARPDMTDDFDPIAFAEQATSHLTPEQTAGVQAYLVGVFSTYVDNPDAVPLTAARWRRYVRAAIAAELRDQVAR